MRPDARRYDALGRACRAHVGYLREQSLCELPSAPLEPGAVAPPLPVDPERTGALLALAARQAAAARGARVFAGRDHDDDLPRATVWTAGADALLVLLDEISVRTADGVVTVSVEVACDELRSATDEAQARVEIDFVVGTEQRPTGLLAAATPPRGPQLVVDRWHDALVALAWQALLDSAAALTASAGVDTDGAPLLPASWTASADGIAVGPQARHQFDRRAPAAVRP